MKSRFTFLILLFSSFSLSAQNAVSDYKAYYAAGTYNGKQILVLRKFTQAGKERYLVTDPQNLETQQVNAAQTTIRLTGKEQALQYFKDSPYHKALQAAKTQALALQDAGIIHGFPKEKGITLTIDLCPSHKGLDRIIFNLLITEFQKTERPVPIALSITGRFMLSHMDDIEWLKGLVKSGAINITWVNHTYNHRYNPKIPLKSNFLLEPGTDLNFEILGTELAMLQQGLTPSVFFRFPGLVSDQQLVDQILSYGIIPIGSDAWLAKGQQAQAGSIVLIHGNGNEPVGVKDFIKLLQTEKDAVNKKHWLLYDLSKSLENEFER